MSWLNWFQNTGCVDASGTWDILSVQGKKTASFLQGQLTIDLSKVTRQAVTFGAQCDIRGQLQACLWIWQHDDNEYHIATHSISAAILEDLWKRYARFEKLTIARMAVAGMQVQGPESFSRLQALFPNASISTFQKLHHQGMHAVVYSHSRALCWGFQEKAADVLPSWYASVQEWWELVPMVSAETRGQHLPYDWGLSESNGLDFKKGCYLGQEIIARIQYKNPVKRIISRAIWEGDLPCEISWNTENGRIKLLRIIPTPQVLLVVFSSAMPLPTGQWLPYLSGRFWVVPQEMSHPADLLNALEAHND